MGPPVCISGCLHGAKVFMWPKFQSRHYSSSNDLEEGHVDRVGSSNDDVAEDIIDTEARPLYGTETLQ